MAETVEEKEAARRLGNCVVCQTMMAQPTVPHERWVCGEPCLAKAPAGAGLRPKF